jgi:hypothetical protein
MNTDEWDNPSDAIKSIMLEKEKQTHFWLRIRHQVLDETPCMHSSGRKDSQLVAP